MRHALLRNGVRRFMLAAATTLAAACCTANADTFTRVAILSGMQEVPINASAGTGYARIVIDTVANTLSYRIVYTGLGSAETAAHIHGFSDPGVSSGVLHPLPAGNTKVGVWNYPEASEASILAGKTYINVHSVGFPGGEIRGQIVAAVADLDGNQEVPPSGSAGRGFGLFNIDTTTNTLSYYIAYGGLGSAESAAHIHGMAVPTVSAGVVHPFSSGSPKIGSWTYPEAQEQAILDGMTYANIHTLGFPGGEIRGQIVFSVNPIEGSQEVPGNAVTGNGGALISIDRINNRMGYDVRRDGLTGPETASHIHGYSAIGVSAGVLQALPAGSTKRGLWNFGAANLNNVLNGLTYVNCHTGAFPGGEIRGQIQSPSILPCSPLITTQPNDTTANDGSPTSFTLVADPRGGGGPNYQWRFNGSPLNNNAIYSGVTTATLSISAATAAQAGPYDCVVTNPCGGMASNVVTLTIAPPNTCGTSDFNGDGDFGTDADIEAFFACLAGQCCPTCYSGGSDFNADGDFGTDADIEAFFRVLAGQPC